MATQASPYDLIGEAQVTALVQRFYDLVERDPAYARLRGLHGSDMAPVRHGFERFLTGWLGGPRDWFGEGKCVMSLHGSMAIDPDLAKEWSDAMAAAIGMLDWEDDRLADELEDALSRMARAMIRKH